jgi:hypothetical protein
MNSLLLQFNSKQMPVHTVYTGRDTIENLMLGGEWSVQTNMKAGEEDLCELLGGRGRAPKSLAGVSRDLKPYTWCS